MLKNKFIHIGTILFALVVAFAACSGPEEEIVLYSNAGANHLNVETEGYKVTMSAEPAPEGQSGKWIIYMGENGRFEDENDPGSVFYGEPGEYYHLGWEVSLGDQYKASIAEVSFKSLQPELKVELPDTLHNNVSIQLEAVANEFGATGEWTIIEGEGGRILDGKSAIAGFIGKEGQEYTLRWTLKYGEKEEWLERIIVTDTLRANGGGNLLDVVTSEDEEKYLTLKGILPLGASGSWELLDQHESGKVLVQDDPSSLFKGVANTEYTLAWSLELDEYVSTDTIKVLFRGKWGTWTDERDGQSYRYVVLNGLEWMADNFNYLPQETEYGRSWYYGQSPRAKVYDGKPVETDEERKYYGRHYNYFAAIEMIPEGWRLPTAGEYRALIPYLGGELYANDKMVEGGDSGLELVYAGTVSYANGSIETFDHCMWQGFGGIYMTSTYNPDRFEVSGMIIEKNFDGIAFKPSAGYFQGMSVRFVRDIQK